MRAILVYNQHSGSALPPDELIDKLQTNGITVLEAIPISTSLEKQLQSHLSRDDVTIVAYGGDGTINATASLLVGTNVTLAPLAGGTLNHFTKDLGISQNLDEAIQDLKKATPRAIDVASVNDRIILNNSSIGLYPSSLKTRDEIESKQIGKWRAAIIASFKAFARYHSYTVTINDETFKTPFIFIGNNDYKIEDQLIGGRVRLDQGILSAYAVTHTSRARLLLIFMRALFRQLKSSDDIKIWKAQQLVIHTKSREIRVSRDGEYERLKTPLEYKMLPASLKIIGGSHKK